MHKNRKSDFTYNVDDGGNLIAISASAPYMSIGRYSGGIRLNNHNYRYVPEHDYFIREDWYRYVGRVEWNELMEAIKKGEKPILKKKPKTKAEPKPNLPSMFD